MQPWDTFLWGGKKDYFKELIKDLLFLMILKFAIKKKHLISVVQENKCNFKALLWAFEDCRAQFHLGILKRDNKIVLYSADHKLLL